MSKIHWEIKCFEELELKELYNMISLRVDVFVVEQNCPYQDLDGKDQFAFHLLGKNKNKEIVATARILPKGVSYKEIAIGRVVTSESIRKDKKGNELMQECMNYIGEHYPKENVRLSAQSHLVNYYSKHGFKKTGKEYLEDGIPHSEMLYVADF
jgi:ElaA protein